MSRNLSYADLNSRLVEVLPELTTVFAKEQDWWEGEEIPKHVAYGNILTPFLEEHLLATHDDRLMSRAFALLEELASSTDPLVREVVTDTMCEYIVDRAELYSAAKRFMGPRTAELCRGTEVGS